MTVEQMTSITYRYSRFTNKAARLSSMLCSMDQSVPALTRNEDGSYSEEKTQALADELTAAWECWRRYEAQEKGERAEPGTALSDIPFDIPAAEREFYSHFFYVVLRLRDMVLVGPCEIRTFDDIVSLALEEFPVRPNLLYQEIFFPLGLLPDGFFGVADGLYWTLFGHKVTADEEIPPEDIEVLREIHWSEVQYYDLKADLVGMPDLAKAMEAAMPAEYWSAYRRILDNCREQDEKAYAELAAHRDTFGAAYLRCRRGYFSIEHLSGEDIRLAVNGAILIYLTQKGKTFFDDEAFFAAYGLLDQAEKQLRGLLSGEG